MKGGTKCLKGVPFPESLPGEQHPFYPRRPATSCLSAEWQQMPALADCQDVSVGGDHDDERRQWYHEVSNLFDIL